MSDRMIYTDAGYAISYHGGRLADVLINGHAVECVQVRRLIGSREGFAEPEPTDDEIRERVAAFINPEDMGHYRDMAR
jgi:hypothetical protein